jgi:hypothetical protein
MSKQTASSSKQPKRQTSSKKHDEGLSDKERVFVHALRALFDPKGKTKSVEEVPRKGFVSGKQTSGASEKKSPAAGMDTSKARSRISRKTGYFVTHGKRTVREKRSMGSEASSEKKKLSPSAVKRAEKRADKRKAYRLALHPDKVKASGVAAMHRNVPLVVIPKTPNRGSNQTLYDSLQKGVSELDVVEAWGGVAALRILSQIGRSEKRSSLTYKCKVYRPYDIVRTPTPPEMTGDTVWDNLSLQEYQQSIATRSHPSFWKNARFDHSTRDYTKVNVAEVDLQKCRTVKAKLFHSFGSLRLSPVTSPVVKASKVVATTKSDKGKTVDRGHLIKNNAHARRVERRAALRREATLKKEQELKASQEAAAKAVKPVVETTQIKKEDKDYYFTGLRKHLTEITEVVHDAKTGRITEENRNELLALMCGVSILGKLETFEERVGMKLTKKRAALMGLRPSSNPHVRSASSSSSSPPFVPP